MRALKVVELTALEMAINNFDEAYTDLVLESRACEDDELIQAIYKRREEGVSDIDLVNSWSKFINNRLEQVVKAKFEGMLELHSSNGGWYYEYQDSFENISYHQGKKQQDKINDMRRKYPFLEDLYNQYKPKLN